MRVSVGHLKIDLRTKMMHVCSMISLNAAVCVIYKILTCVLGVS